MAKPEPAKSDGAQTAPTTAPPAALSQARILAEALPYMQRYSQQTVVVNFGGHAMGDADLAAAFAQDIVLLKQSGVNPIVVHGGGPQIAGMLKRLQIKSEFVQGLRVTDKPTVEVVEMVLAGLINKDIVTAINRQGGKAVGISGKDANLMIARKITQMPDPESNLMKAVDIGYVGDPAEVNPHIVNVISSSDIIPVIAPVAISREGETLNINADTFASALAARMKAKRLLLLTDVAGVLDKGKKLIDQLSIEEARKLIRDGVITDGMIPKVEGCIEVVEAGVEAVVILDGRVPHCVLLELFTEHGVGTLVGRKVKKIFRMTAPLASEGSNTPTLGEALRAVASTRGFDRTETSIFDLDNTLYPADCNLFAQVDQRMGEFIARYLGVPFEYARHLQKTYYRQFGTTLSGLMQVHKMDPKAFLDYVHDIDLSVVAEHPDLAAAIEALPGRKLIFTNGSRAHAERVAGKVGVFHLFDGVFDIVDAAYVPKPVAACYDQFLRAHGVKADTSAMFEDMPHNLEAPHALGMTTVLVRSAFNYDHPVQKTIRGWLEPPAHVHHMTDDLTGFLQGIRAPSVA